MGFSDGSVVKYPPAKAGDAGDMGSIPVLGRSPGDGDGNPLQYSNGNPLQYSCLENSIDRGAWQATVHTVAKSGTQLRLISMHAHWR